LENRTGGDEGSIEDGQRIVRVTKENTENFHCADERCSPGFFPPEVLDQTNLSGS
jgi:hypothetical protein